MSICESCEHRICTYKGCPATLWEPEEPPEFECYLYSFNFMTEDGCCNYDRQIGDDREDLAYDEWKEAQYERRKSAAG